MAGLVRKVARHYHWARTEGVARLIEEDQLDPGDRVRVAWSKASWRRRHPRPAGRAVPVFVVGLQRSGTNMLVRGLERAPEFEVHNENDRRAFSDFRLKPDATVQRIIARSRHDFVLFKPLCDSHRTRELLDLAPGARAIWVVRGVDDRVRSSVSKFGDSNLQALRAIAAGTGLDRWEAGGLSAQQRALLQEMDLDQMSAESASALLWCLRNETFFAQGLEQRADVSLVSYEQFCADPAGVMSDLCASLGFPYRDELVAGVRPRPPRAPAPLPLDPRVRAMCDDMEARLGAASRLRGGAA